MGSNLASLFSFFDRPYATPAAALTPAARAFVLNQASFALRGQGRLQEALPAMLSGLHMEEAGQDWANAAISASNLSETELLIGDIVAAMATAKKVVALADRAGNIPQILGYRTALPDVLHAAGEWGKAADLFADVERRQREVRPGHPFLYSLQGYRYCDSLLSQGRAVEARDRATLTLRRAKTHNFVLDVALDTLTLGRAHCTLALQSLARRASAEAARDDLRAAAFRLDGAVEGLLGSGDSARLVRGFIARAAFRRTVGDWDGAKRDLDEAKEIAEPGLMRLYWCDCALEDARLALARREAFAPLNGLVEQSPPPPVLPDSDEAARLKEEARKELDVARKLIAECGYHRRDEELAEVDEVVADRRRFADLPPRV